MCLRIKLIIIKDRDIYNVHLLFFPYFLSNKYAVVCLSPSFNLSLSDDVVFVDGDHDDDEHTVSNRTTITTWRGACNNAHDNNPYFGCVYLSKESLLGLSSPK